MSARSAVNITLPLPTSDLQTWAQQLTERLQSLLTRLTYDNNVDTILYKLMPLKDSTGRTLLDPEGIHIYALDDFEVISGPVIRIRTEELQDNAITTSKLAAGSITATKITDNAITTPKLAAGAVVAGKIGANAIVANDGVIGTAAIADAQIASLNAAKITAGSIAAERMSANIVTALEGQFATLGALAASLGAVKIRPGGKLYTESAVDMTTGTGVIIMEDKIRAGSATSQLLWDGTKLVLGNPAGARVEIVGGTLTIYDASGTTLLSSGAVKIPFYNLTGIPGGVGQNMLRNSSRARGVGNDDLFGFYTNNPTGFDNISAEHGINEDIWALAATASRYLRSSGAPVTGRTYTIHTIPQLVPVTPGEWYEFSALTGVHRAIGQCSIFWVDATYTPITAVTGAVANNNERLGGTTLAHWKRVGGFAQAPAGAAYAFIEAGFYTQTADNAYVFLDQFYLGKAYAGQTSFSAWTDGGVFISNTAQLTDGAGLGSTALWAGVSGTGKPEDNATVGAGFGVNIYGQITGANASTYIASAAIGSALIANAAILAAHIANAQIVNAHIVDGTIQAAKIGNAQILNAHIGDAQITSAKIVDAAITNAKIGGDLQSDNFVAGSAGWRIRKSTGEAEFRNITLRGQVEDIRNYTAGDYEIHGDRGVINSVGQALDTWKKHREIRCARSGTVRVIYGWASLYDAYGTRCMVQKNNTFVQMDSAPSGAFDRLWTVDVSVVPGDLISQWLYLPTGYGGNIVYTHTLALSAGIIFNESTSFRLIPP